MLIYIVGFLITIIFTALLENKVKNKKIKILFYILAVLPFFLISAFRYDVGTDYIKRYTNDYLDMAQGKNIGNLEIGFKVINYICLNFTKEPYLLFVVTSIIILLLFFIVIFKEANNKVLSIAIFFLGGYFFASLNLVRQFIAIGFLFVGYTFLIKENKKIKYLGFIICEILAILMHSSSIVGCIFLLLNKNKAINFKFILVISIILLFFNESIMNIFRVIIEKTRFNVYLSGNMAKGQVSLLTILENLFVYIWMYRIYYNLNRKNYKSSLLLNIQAVALITTTAGVCHMQFLRIALYFSVFQILSIPYFVYRLPLKKIKSKIKKIFKKDISKKRIVIVTNILVIISFISIFSYTNVLNNDNEVIPYKTIFTMKDDSKL